MKTSKPSILRVAVMFYVWLLATPVVPAQEDRGERVQESVTSSDQRIDFTSRKAAPSKIDSVDYQDSLKKRLEFKRAKENFARRKAEVRKKAAERGSKKPSADEEKALAEDRGKVERARAALKDAERKANAD